MSLFGSMMPGLEDDPAFGSANQMMRQMDTMMSSMMRDPFGGDPFASMMGSPMMGSPMMGMGMMGAPPMRQQQQSQLALMGPAANNMNALNIMANPMTMMNTMMSNMDNMRGESTNQVFSSSSVMSMTTGPDGRPQVYQSTSSSRGVPGGVRETQHSVSDSSTGLRKMAIGHHIGDRAHIVEKERNRDGEEERQEFLNLDEDEADEFEDQFRHAVNRPRHVAIDSGRSPRNAAAAPLAIEGSRADRYSRDRPETTAPERQIAPLANTSDRYNIERINVSRSNGIDLSKFDRNAADRSVDHLEYHRPNTNYTPAPTSYSRPSSHMPALSGGGGRAQHSRSNRRPAPYNQ